MRILTKTLITAPITAIVLLAAPIAAAAMDRDTAFSPEMSRWQGFYMGGHGGWIKSRGRDGASGARLGGNLGTAGLHAGYNWQRRNLVFGVELDADLLGFGKVKSKGPLRKSLLAPLASARGRLGHVIGNSLLYVTGGFGLGIGSHKLGGSRKSRLHPGWIAGGGIEHALGDRWSLRGEYLYANYGKKKYGFSAGSRRISYEDSHTVRAGLSYRF